jgi:nicotinamide phosphoribosyltransferase
LQMFLKKLESIGELTTEDVDVAEMFAKAHGEPFDRNGWDYIVQELDGQLPITIHAVPEGLPLPGGTPLVRVDCEDPKVFWLSSYIETMLQRAVWYPSTVASLDYSIKKDIAHFYRISGADMSMLPFALHDFGARGVTCGEQAEIGGAAHLVNFMGSDTIEGVIAANYYYNDNMAGFSVPATEHSVECSFGLDEEGELEYLKNTIETLGKPGGIVSIVIDGRDVFRAAKALCTTLKDVVINSGAKVVFRPDSGDMMEVVPRILEMQYKAFGGVKNVRGYIKINNVGIIQGDGVDHMSIKSLLGKVLAMGFSADNVIFGSGGSLLQKVNRDTFKFAQKASEVRLEDGTRMPIFKDPITDPGKRSRAGAVLTLRSKVTGEILVATDTPTVDSEFEVLMRPVWKNGILLVDESLSTIRSRCVV